MALVHDDRGRVMAGIGQALRITVLICGIHREAPVPCFCLRKFEIVGLSRPFQDVALVFGDVSAAETEQHGIHTCAFDWRKNKRYELIASQWSTGIAEGRAAVTMDHGAVPVEQEAALGTIRIAGFWRRAHWR